LKGSEALGIVALIIMLVGIPSFFAYVTSVSNSDDIESTTEKTTEFILDFTISEIIGTIVLIVVGSIISILVVFGILKRG